jgi:predicted nucleic acid-binding protein
VGSLTLPPNGTVYVDANALIYSVEKVPDYWPILEPLWEALDAGKIRVASSQLLVLEALVGPLKRGDVALLNTYDELFRSGQLELNVITEDLLRRAASLRALHGIKTPDAIHAATALSIGCALCITNDEGLRKVQGLPLIVLKDVLALP